MKYLSLILILFFVISCVPVPEDNQEEVVLDLSDPNIQKIYSLQTKQDADSLKLFFSHESASLRYLSAMAFASFQSVDDLDEVASLLFDTNKKVQQAAAYAIGQIGESSGVNALLEAFDSNPDEVNSVLNRTILEAVGKCGDKDLLDFMATTSTYQLEDNNLLLGQARGIYRFSLRGITSENGTKRMAEMIINTAFPSEARVMASNYLFRSTNIDISDYKFQLFNVLTDEEDVRIRMCLAGALGRLGDQDIVDSLLEYIKSENDFRVRVNVLRSFERLDDIAIVDSIIPYLSEDDPHVALAALEIIKIKSDRSHSPLLKEMSNAIADSEIRAGLLFANLATTPFSYRSTKKLIVDQINTEYNRAVTDYKKLFYLSALAADPEQYKNIIEKAKNTESPIIKTKAILTLGNIFASDNFVNIFRTRQARNRVKSEILEFILDRITSGDHGEMAASGEVLLAYASDFDNVFTDSLLLVTEIRQLSGTESAEAKQALSRALAALTSFEFVEEDPMDAKMLDWQVLQNISNSPLAIIVTAKGRITVELMPLLAPATVANFIQLTDANFYDQKHFHRVVANFVVQGGCPRDDGYGSLEYSIRSELPDLYYDREGYMGMASIGSHTESSQWFITHSPTPHLDGRYSIFGKVSEGMDVVHSLRIGDIIQDIRILKYN